MDKQIEKILKELKKDYGELGKKKLSLPEKIGELEAMIEFTIEQLEDTLDI